MILPWKGLSSQSKNRLWSVGMFGPFLMSFAKTWERNIPTDSSPRCESPGSWCISYHLKQIEITMKHVSKSQSLKVSKSTVASAELREYNSTSIASCDIAPSWHSIVRGLKQHTNRSRPHEWPVEVDVPIVCTHLGHWRFFCVETRWWFSIVVTYPIIHGREIIPYIIDGISHNVNYP